MTRKYSCYPNPLAPHILSSSITPYARPVPSAPRGVRRTRNGGRKVGEVIDGEDMIGAVRRMNDRGGSRQK